MKLERHNLQMGPKLPGIQKEKTRRDLRRVPASRS